MGDQSDPRQSKKNTQPTKKRANRLINNSSEAPQSENTQPAKKRANRFIGDTSAPPLSENTQPSKTRQTRLIGAPSASPQNEKNTQPTKTRETRLIGAPPQIDKNTQPTKNKFNTVLSDLSAVTQSEKNSQPTKKRVRGATRMAQLSVKRLNGQKIPIDFDQRTKKPIGENRKKFKSNVGSIARSKISILVDQWDNVDEKIKDQIWEDITVILFMIVNCNT
jgi:hypothetical protein